MVKYDENGRPQIKEKPDFSLLIKTTESIMNDMMSGNWHEDNDDATYIYESAMEAIYGNGIFEFINRLDEEEQ